MTAALPLFAHADHQAPDRQTWDALVLQVAYAPRGEKRSRQAAVRRFVTALLCRELGWPA